VRELFCYSERWEKWFVTLRGKNSLNLHYISSLKLSALLSNILLTNMKTLWLLLAILGFIAPNIFVINESIATGNVLLWLDAAATLQGMFGNRISTAFVTDLLFAVLTFFIWSYYESKRTGIKNFWVIWVLTVLFGMAGSFPLFLYLREKKMEVNR